MAEGLSVVGVCERGLENVVKQETRGSGETSLSFISSDFYKSKLTRESSISSFGSTSNDSVI